jgi:hypothetical protein
VVIGEDTTPGARTVLRLIISRAQSVSLAIDGIRLAAIDFAADDLSAVQRCRVVLGRFDNIALQGAVESASNAPDHAGHLDVLRGFLMSGRAEIRSAGARRWNPDFCVARGPALARWFDGGAVALIGHLGLGAVNPHTGPRLTCVISGSGPVATVARSFEQLWNGGHDILAVVAEALGRQRNGRQ